MLIFMQKILFIPHLFLEILQDTANFLMWVLWARLAMPTKSNSTNVFILMFISKQKLYLIPQSFLQI